jgi:hypothetical protein
VVVLPLAEPVLVVVGEPPAPIVVAPVSGSTPDESSEQAAASKPETMRIEPP